MSTSYAINNVVFQNFLFYAVASVIKMMAMSLLTSKQRFSKKVNKYYFDISTENNFI
jgi:hypothetical protein